MTSELRKTAGVMGWPIGHSLSPRLHGYWIRKYDLDADYVARAVKPEDLADTLRDLPAQCWQQGEIFRGTNLTVPLKETALEIVDILDPSAARIGAVNTIVVGENGELIGRNTDAIGFTESLKEQVNLSRFGGGQALILGAGGAARAVATALVDMKLAKIMISNRSPSRAADLARHLGETAQAIAWEDRHAAVAESDLLINTTSLGMTGQPVLEISLDALKETAVVTDIVYVPLETALLKAAAARGNVTVDGLGMLLHQAKAGFEAWFGVTPEVDAGLRHHVLEGLK